MAELTGMLHLLSADCEKTCLSSPRLGPWADGIRLAMYVGLDKLEQMVLAMWEGEFTTSFGPSASTCRVESMLMAMRLKLPWACQRDFEMMVWDRWPALRAQPVFELDLAIFSTVRAHAWWLVVYVSL